MFLEQRGDPRIDLGRQRLPGIRERYREVRVAQQALVVWLVPMGAVELFEQVIELVLFKHYLFVTSNRACIHDVLQAGRELQCLFGGWFAFVLQFFLELMEQPIVLTAMRNIE